MIARRASGANVTVLVRVGDAERVAAGTAVREDLPLVVAGRAAVADVLVGEGGRAGGDVGPGRAVPLLQVEVEVGARGSGQDAAVGAGDRRLVVRAVRLDRRRARAAQRAAVRRAAAATGATGVRRLEGDAAVRRVGVEADVVVGRDRVRDRDALGVAAQVRTVVIDGRRRLRAALLVQV